MFDTVRWIAWGVAALVSSLTGVLNVSLVVVWIVTKKESPSPIPVVGQLALIVAWLAIPDDAPRSLQLATHSLVFVWLAYYVGRLVFSARTGRSGG